MPQKKLIFTVSRNVVMTTKTTFASTQMKKKNEKTVQ
jgi:hypothetical protein